MMPRHIIVSLEPLEYSNRARNGLSRGIAGAWAIKERLYPDVNYPAEGLLLRPFLAAPFTANRPRYDA
jgi:hypothetical protein